MTRSLLLVLAAAVLGTAAWLALSASAPSTSPADVPAQEGEQVSSADAEDPGDLARLTSEADQRIAAEDEASAEQRTGEWAGRTVTGRVVASDGQDLGERVQVRARWRRQGDEGPGGRLSVDASANGEFTVQLPDEVKGLRLDVLGERVALPRPHRVGRDEDDVELVVERGGTLVVRFVGVAADHPEAVPSTAFRVEAAGGPGSEVAPREGYLGGDGLVRIGGLPPDSPWQVRLTAERFVDRFVDTPRVPMGEQLVVDLDLARGVSASGRVIDAEGLPIGGASVRLRTGNSLDAGRYLGRYTDVVTAEDGTFTAGGVLPGEARMIFRATGFLTKREDHGVRGEAEHIEGLEITLDGGATLTGLVRWPDGEPARRADVRAKRPGRSWESASKATADAEGRFELSGMSGNALRLGAWAKAKDGSIWSAEADVGAGEEVVLQLSPGTAVRGVVVDDAGAPVEAFRVTATAMGQGAGARGPSVRVRKGEGAFALSGLGPGLWELRARAKGHIDSRPMVIDGTADSEGIELVLPRLASLGGFLVDRGGAPIPEATLRAGERTATSDEEGAFLLEDIDPGLIELAIGAEGYGPPDGPPITLAAGERRLDARIVLGRGGRVIGTVHPSSREGTEMRAQLRVHDDFKTVYAPIDAEGRFEFTGLRPGRYWAGLGWQGKADWVEGHGKARMVPVEVPVDGDVRVVIGDPRDYPVRVTGKVTRGEEAIVGAIIYVFQGDTEVRLPRTIARTDDEGSYEIFLPGAGAYTFTAGEGQASQSRFLLTITDEPEQRHDLPLPTGSLKGSARLADGSPASGRMYVLTHDDVPTRQMQVGSGHFARTRADGSFTFSDLPAGRYRLRTGNYISAHPTDGLVVIEGIEIPENGAGEPVEVEIPTGATVDVVAVDRAGSALPGRRLELANERGYMATLFDLRTSDHDGLLRFTGVSSGTWTAFAYGPDGQTVVGRATVRADPARAGRVVVTCDS